MVAPSQHPEFGNSEPEFEIDTESSEWFRLSPDQEPQRLPFWHHPLFGNARMAGTSDVQSILQPPDETAPAFLPDTSLILHEQTVYKHPLYLPQAMRNQNLLVSSITGGGKTQRFILPFLIHGVQNGIPSIALDSKSEQHALLKPLCQRPGQICVWNPLHPERTTHAVNILDACGMHAGRWLNICQVFIRADQRKQEQAGGDGQWFENNAARFLAGAGMAILQGTGSVCFADILALLERPTKEIREFLECYDVPFVPSILSFIASGSHNAETILATARNALRLFIDPGLAATTSRSEISLRDIVRRRKTLILEVPPEDAEYLRPVLNTFFLTLFEEAPRLARSLPGNRFPHGLRVYADDFAANIGKIPGLNNTLNTMRSRNFSVVATVQTLGQIEEHYGTEARGVIAGFGGKIFQSPVEHADAEYAARLSGTATIEVEEITEQASGNGDQSEVRISRTRRPQARTLFPAEQIRQAPEHWAYERAATCFLPGIRPFQAWFRPAWDIPRWSHHFQRLRTDRCRKIRRRKLDWEAPDFTTIEGTSPPRHFTHSRRLPTNRIIERLKQTVEELQQGSTSAAKAWWAALQKQHGKQPAMLLRLAEEILMNNGNLQDYYKACQESDSANIAANLHYMKYMQLRDRHSDS